MFWRNFPALPSAGRSVVYGSVSHRPGPAHPWKTLAGLRVSLVPQAFPAGTPSRSSLSSTVMAMSRHHERGRRDRVVGDALLDGEQLSGQLEANIVTTRRTCRPGPSNSISANRRTLTADAVSSAVTGRSRPP